VKDFLEGLAALVAIIAAIIAWRKAAEAKLAEHNATLRAEEALKAAERTAKALEGMHANSSAVLADQKAEREAPAILERWITDAIAEGRNVYANSKLGDAPSFPLRRTITSQAELAAVRLAYKHEDVHRVEQDPERIGGQVVLYVFNPHSSYRLMHGRG